jgi:hypothetical protein
MAESVVAQCGSVYDRPGISKFSSEETGRGK